MPYVYTDSLATPGVLTTSGTANTETETFFLKPGSTRSLYMVALFAGGKAAGATQLSAGALRVAKWGTASTGGTTLSSIAKPDSSSPSTTITSGSRPTSGTTRTNAGPIVTFSQSGPNFWQALNVDHMVALAAGNAGSISALDHGSVASMPFEFSIEHQEW